jgi:hypothetical protein
MQPATRKVEASYIKK